MDPILATLDTLEIGDPISAANLTMFPLLLPEDEAPAYLTLDEALAGGHASVTEVSEAGSVPELLVKNRAPQPILILDGEELIGAKQNRIVNLSILVPARETLPIPVSCVEAGRWARRSREEFKAIGLGKDLRINGEKIVGGALEVDGKVIHLVAFPAA